MFLYAGKKHLVKSEFFKVELIGKSKTGNFRRVHIMPNTISEKYITFRKSIKEFLYDKIGIKKCIVNNPTIEKIVDTILKYAKEYNPNYEYTVKVSWGTYQIHDHVKQLVEEELKGLLRPNHIKLHQNVTIIGGKWYEVKTVNPDNLPYRNAPISIGEELK